MIKVVAALALISILPRKNGTRLVLNHDALLELGVVVLASVTPVLWNLQRIQFLSAMLFRFKIVTRSCS